MVLSFGAFIGEAGLFEDAPRAVVEEGVGDFFALGVLGVAFDNAAAGVFDEVEGSVEGKEGQALFAMIAIDEDAGDSPVGHGHSGFNFFAVIDGGQLLRRAKLAPGDADVASEDEGGVRPVFADQPFFVGARGF